MKLYYKTVLGLLAAAIMLNVSCTKNNGTPTKADNTAALSKQLAMNLYSSLSSGIATTNNNGLKPGSTSNLKTLSGPSCGESIITGTNRTTVNGDTTRTYLGNSIFTYMCNGFYHNNQDLDAYILKDTLATTETGTAFKNNYKTILYYVVKSLDANYNTLGVNGVTSTYSFTSKVNGSTVTESHLVTTDYSWDNITADRSGVRNVFTAGTVSYVLRLVDKDSTTSADGVVNNFTGTMQFLSGNKIRTTMINNGVTKVYETNVLTGETVLVP